MTSRICAVLVVVALGVHASARVETDDTQSRIGGRSSHWEAPLFTELPQPSSPDDIYHFLDPVQPFDPNLNSTFFITLNGQTCIIGPDGNPASPSYLIHNSYRGPVSLALGSTGDGRTLDTIFAAPGGPSNHPLRLYSWGPPASPFGDVNVAGMAEAGLSVTFGDFFGDRMPEFAISYGPNGPPFVRILELNRDGDYRFEPYGPSFKDGTSLASGDLDGDGYDELLTAQDRGGELKAFSFHAGQFIEVGSGRPYGHAFDRGFRVAAIDLDNDGRSEMITIPISAPEPPRPLAFTDDLIRAFKLPTPARTQLSHYDQAFNGLEFSARRRLVAGYDHGRPNLFVSSGRTFTKLEVRDRAFVTDSTWFSNPFRATIDGDSSVSVFTPKANQ